MSPRPKIGSLYFVQADETGPIKIGWTYGDPYIRVRALQQASPNVLRWLGAMRAPQSAEAEAHNRFRHCRHRNEWFYPASEVLDFIRECSGDFSPELYVRVHFRRDLIERIDALRIGRRGRIDEILDAARVAAWTYAHWREKTSLLTDEQYRRLERAIDAAEAERLAA